MSNFSSVPSLSQWTSNAAAITSTEMQATRYDPWPPFPCTAPANSASLVSGTVLIVVDVELYKWHDHNFRRDRTENTSPVLLWQNNCSKDHKFLFQYSKHVLKCIPWYVLLFIGIGANWALDTWSRFLDSNSFFVRKTQFIWNLKKYIQQMVGRVKDVL
jgi:hypothetical protein